ncbi:autotransporter-associated beta strand repeat-containing protein [Luteolibacter ambystomatis]|uniref:Autotransporter-associated beta strand repeat-containing protein n=1 Tax=Luteolibacter ambystomatis TaxID=2824561 RepID=A0A975PH26_9BACT|nr:autotransporter-associated beta strand repeat-containing protein [Luteolibacter ambystomatis]QUE53170.1 autotransporter-associated beta strand repeat-containing protein [Luteolibacter ambystomatis]
MKPKASLRTRLLQTAATLALLPGLSHAVETFINGTTANVNVNAGDSIGFDFFSNTAITLGTINGSTPATGPLPGWAHTQWGFLKYDGTQVVPVSNAEKAIGPGTLATATAPTTYFDGFSDSTVATSQSIGNLETTRDFLISNGATVDIALGGLMFHNQSHWLKVGSGSGFVTSSSGTLAIVANGGGDNYQVNEAVIKDYNGSTPLKLIKTGGDHFAINSANTYTGGTWVNNGRLRLDNTNSLGTGMARAVGTNSQLWFNANGTFANAIQIEGNGWSEGVGQLGAIRFSDGVVLGGPVALTGAARVVVNGGSTATISGALSGTAALELGTSTYDASGTLNLNGSSPGYTGAFTLTRGRANLNGTLGGSVIVNDGLTLGGTGTINGNLTVGTTAGAKLALTPGSPLTVLGTVTFEGPNKLTLPSLPANGTWPVMNHGGLAGAGGFTIDSSLYRKTVALDTSTPGVINLTVSGSNLPLVWTGAANTTWDVNGSTNWTAGSGNIPFLLGDDVLFDDTSTVNTVDLNAVVQPTSVTFNTANTYTLNAGNGNGITGPTGLTKNGTGTLVLGGTGSSYTGPVLLNAGTIKLNNWEPLGFTSGVTVAAGATLDFAGNAPAWSGRVTDYTVAGDGVDGFGALANSGGDIYEGSGIRNFTLSADASLGAKGGRFDLCRTNNSVGIITGNGHTLTLNADKGMGIRGDASGSPIHYVVAAGRVWVENSDKALGGTTGDVRVKSGARVGTYGTRTIATPVILESGGALYVEGGDTGTWTGAVSVTDAFTLDAGPNVLALTGTVTGAAALTKTGGNTAIVAHPSYTGNTTISAGTLSLGAATLDDSSTVNIADGAKLALTHGQADIVGALFINGVAMASGTYGATGSGAGIIDDAHFSGSGRLTVAGPGSYTAWAVSHGVGEANADDDHDGIRNGIEFLIGGNPAASGDGALLPVVMYPPGSVQFIYFRDGQAANYPSVVQYSSDLSVWTDAVDGVDGVSIVSDPSGVVTVTVPRALAVSSRLFLRLKLPVL